MEIKSHHISYQQTSSFSNLVIDYLHESKNIEPFIQEFPSKEAIQKQIARKKTQDVDRQLLHNVLVKQYEGIPTELSVKQNMTALLSENTYTICTAHQPNIFTGYLYFIYKIIHAIKLAKECTNDFPDYHFAPVYYMGSEDNDFDEIGVFHYNDKTYTWETKQTGACGRMNCSELVKIVNEIKITFNEDIVDEANMINLLTLAYNGTNTLAQATRILVNALFGKHGLLILDGDDINLKTVFSKVMKEEILFQNSLEIVNQTIQAFPTNYKVQANPRAINLFYLKESLRERIEKVEDRWLVMNSEISFSQEEIIQEIETHPHHFSPNVILRPLYQESILPNIAFVGGGGELSYWLELKSLFEKNKIVYPIIFLRNSVLWLSAKADSLMNKLSLEIEEIFLQREEIFKLVIQENESIKIAQKILDEISIKYDELISLGNTISPQLKISMEAHRAKVIRIEKRMLQKFIAQIKKREEIIFTQIGNLKHEIAPNGTLQERYDNFMTLYKLHGMKMFDILLENQEPYGKEFLVLKVKTNSEV